MANELTDHSELRSSLQALHDRSHKASRRLDDTYYTILEKVRGLRQHIENLRELSGLTKELHDTFSANTNDLAEEIGGQIDAFDNFTYQEEQLEKLENRIIVGREKARALNIRLCRARKVVEARSKVEAEWEGKTKSMPFSMSFGVCWNKSLTILPRPTATALRFNLWYHRHYSNSHPHTAV